MGGRFQDGDQALEAAVYASAEEVDDDELVLETKTSIIDRLVLETKNINHIATKELAEPPDMAVAVAVGGVGRGKN